MNATHVVTADSNDASRSAWIQKVSLVVHLRILVFVNASRRCRLHSCVRAYVCLIVRYFQLKTAWSWNYDSADVICILLWPPRPIFKLLLWIRNEVEALKVQSSSVRWNSTAGRVERIRSFEGRVVEIDGSWKPSMYSICFVLLVRN